MKKRTRLTLLAGVVMLAGFMVFMGAGSYAANPETVGVSVTVSPTTQLSMTGIPVAYGALAPQDPPAEDTTKVLGVRINSNRDWALGITTSGNLTDSGSNTIPSGNFLFQGENAGPSGVTLDINSYQEFGAKQIAHGTRGGNRTLDVRYSLLIDWDVAPAAYSATHTYTVTNP